MMIYVWHHIQTFTGCLLTFLIRSYFCQEWDRVESDTPGKRRALYACLTAMIVPYHLSLLWLTASPITYLWFWMAVLHFWIHSKQAYKTAVENKYATLDEWWHITNQTLSTYYLWSHGYNYIPYLVLMVPYYILLVFVITQNRCIKESYYLASVMQALFVLSLDQVDLTITAPLLAIHLFVSWIITYQNQTGRGFLKAGVASAAFNSEALVLHMVHNGVY